VTQHEFGGAWTESKLVCLRKYLEAYTTIFHGNPKARYFRTVYVDAFAGTGYWRTGRRADAPTLFKGAEAQKKGSARLALEVERPFHQYIFIEKNDRYVQELERLRSQFPDRAIQIETGDANSYLQRWCRDSSWRRQRAVVFLDPYGMQVEWTTLSAIAATKAIDAWLLFPLGAVSRRLPRDAPPDAKHEPTLRRVFGTDDWRTALYSTDDEPTLFEDDASTGLAPFSQKSPRTL
jgi:three-Cys-motif partner protein